MREGRVELPRPFGHRILRLLALRTRPGSTCRPASFSVVPCLRVSSCREQPARPTEKGSCFALFREGLPSSAWPVLLGSSGSSPEREQLRSASGIPRLSSLAAGESGRRAPRSRSRWPGRRRSTRSGRPPDTEAPSPRPSDSTPAKRALARIPSGASSGSPQVLRPIPM